MRSATSPPSPASFGQLAAIFLLALAGTALVVAFNLLLPSLAQTGLLQNVLRLIVLGLNLYAAWIGLSRAGFASQQRLNAWLAIAVPLLAWQSIGWWLGATGGFDASPILVPVAIVAPVLIGLPVLLRSATIGKLLDATPPEWLVGLQVYRVVGISFVVGWLGGTLPGTFALPAGLGDTLVGVLALPVALWLQSGGRGSRALAVGWNVLGILDMLDAVTLGLLTAASPAYPLILIPTLGVPLSFLLHALSLRQLRRAARQEGRPAAAPTPVTAYA